MKRKFTIDFVQMLSSEIFLVSVKDSYINTWFMRDHSIKIIQKAWMDTQFDVFFVQYDTVIQVLKGSRFSVNDHFKIIEDEAREVL
jgi:hypothetical protein